MTAHVPDRTLAWLNSQIASLRKLLAGPALEGFWATHAPALLEEMLDDRLARYGVAKDV